MYFSGQGLSEWPNVAQSYESHQEHLIIYHTVYVEYFVKLIFERFKFNAFLIL